MKAAAMESMKAAAMKAPAMKSMKAAMKTMKAMKAMKKRASTIARGRAAKAMVLKGSKVKTGGGLTKDKLTKNKSGKIVSKAASAVSKKAYQGSKAQAWSKATKA